jgi:hypothetical protein
VPLGDARCPGVSEPGLGSPLPHQGRATPRLVGSPAGACATEAGVSGTQRIDRTRADRHEGLSPPFFQRFRTHGMRTNSSARRVVARQQERRLAKTREVHGGKRPRVVTITVAELTHARLHQEPRVGERRCPRPTRPVPFTRHGARLGLGLGRTNLEIARGSHGRDDGTPEVEPQLALSGRNARAASEGIC